MREGASTARRRRTWRRKKLRRGSGGAHI